MDTYAQRLTRIIDALDELKADAEDSGDLSIAHPTAEALARLKSARTAAEQAYGGTTE